MVYLSINRPTALAIMAIIAGTSLSGLSMPVQAQIAISVNIAPPPLPVYEQPPLPGPGYIWVPGYWSWDPDFGDYYWVPGYWSQPPRVNYYWTPGYWSWRSGVYIFNAGYWGPSVGFYGGINYGFGYTGFGFYGGYWSSGAFFYNGSVTNITNVTNVTNIYQQQVTNVQPNGASFNGGKDGVKAGPTPQQQAALKQPHIPQTQQQIEHARAAARDPSSHLKANKGKPPVKAVPKVGDLKPTAEPKPAPENAQSAPKANHAAPQIKLTQPKAKNPVNPSPHQPDVSKPQAAPKPQAAKPQSSKPRASRPKAAKPRVSRPQASRPRASRPQFARPHISRPHISRPSRRAAPRAWHRPSAPRPARPRSNRRRH
jgi:WXXGXW repeat (2 copies)